LVGVWCDSRKDAVRAPCCVRLCHAGSQVLTHRLVLTPLMWVWHQAPAGEPQVQQAAAGQCSAAAALCLLTFQTGSLCLPAPATLSITGRGALLRTS
jgi:hypothetical protein